MTGSWHADDALLARYVLGDAGLAQGASVEAHLTSCADCRARIAAHVPERPLELVWERIRDEAEAPPSTAVQRLLVRLGLPEPDALLVAAAPSLRSSWLLGLAVTLTFVALAAAYGGARGLTLFLLVAPLVPVAGVAVAYGPDVDPAYEASRATPYPMFRLMLLRTAAVLVTCLPLVLAAAMLVPGRGAETVAWLLPALAFSAVVLAASTWCRPAVAGTGLALAWACAVVTAALMREVTAVLAPVPLLGYCAVGLAAAAVLSRRLRRPIQPGSPT